jgi:hypothetical protein
MDPLHPIIPIPPHIPPVTPAPMAGRVDRDASHTGADPERRRRRRSANPDSSSYDEGEYAVGDPGDEDDPGLHINVTA